MGMKQRDLELLAEYETDLITTLNLTYLLPHLTSCGLLTRNDEDILTKPDLTRQDAIKKFLSILKTKGLTAFSLFTDALYNEREHLGHESLYKTLTCEVHGKEKKQSVVKDNEPHPLATTHASIRQSTSANNLCSDSGISQGSSSGTSSAASVDTVALTILQRQLNSMKDQMDEHSQNISALTKKMDEVLHTSSSMRTSNSLPTIARRKSLSKTNLDLDLDCSLNEQLPSSTSCRQSAKRPRLKRSTTCSFPIIKKDPVPKNSKVYYLSSKRIPEADESILESVECSIIPSNSLILPPITKDNEAYFISFNKNPPGKSATKDTLHSFGLQSRQWNNRDIGTASHQNQAVFPLLYKDDIAIIRLSLMERHDQSAKVGIYKLKEMSLWDLIAFTSDKLRPIELENCQCAPSTRYIVLASISQSTITFHLWKHSSQSWSTINFPLPPNKISSELQSCAIANHTAFCSVKSTERNHQQKVTIYKLKLEYATEKDKPQNNPNLDIVYNYDLNVSQCYLFAAGGEIMMMKVIVSNGDNRSSTLELCSLNDTLLNLKTQKKEYAFVIELLSIISLHTNTYNTYNHVLIVYYDSRFSKTYFEIFSLPLSTRN